MTHDLKSQLELAVADVFAPDDAAEKAIAHVRRHRRISAAAAALAIIAAVVAIPLLITGTSDSQGRPATLVPTSSPSPSPSTRATPAPGSQQIIPLTPSVTVNGTGTQTVDLGPAPAQANGVDMQFVCLSAGTFSITPGGAVRQSVTEVGCNASDVPGPRGASIPSSYAMPFLPGQHSLEVTTVAKAKWRLTARYAVVIDTAWAVNASGKTYGVPNDTGEPNLIAVTFGVGKTGYVYSSELGPTSCPHPANPTQALQWQNTPLVTVHIPVYLSDGKTRIGQLDKQVHQAYVQAQSQCPQPHPIPAR